MGKGKNLELSAPPTYQENPNLGKNITFGSDYFKQLLGGNFTGDLSWLAPLTNTNTSKDALLAAQGILQPQFRDTLNQITQSATNANSLNSSTFTDALARSQSDLNSQYQAMVGQGAINDAYQNNANRLNLLSQGSAGLQNFTGLAQNQTNSQNEFNLQNYGNLVAKAIQDNQNSRNPGFFGNFISGISPLGHDVFSAQGYNVPGMGIQQAGLTAAGFMAGGPVGGAAGYNLGGGMQQPAYTNPFATTPTAARSTGSTYLPGMFAQNPTWSSGLGNDSQAGFYNGLYNSFGRG